jgi:hypothetical protein
LKYLQLSVQLVVLVQVQQQGCWQLGQDPGLALLL